jgi:hypothetical protein
LASASSLASRSTLMTRCVPHPHSKARHMQRPRAEVLYRAVFFEVGDTDAAEGALASIDAHCTGRGGERERDG